MSVVHEAVVACDKCGESFRFESPLLPEEWIFEGSQRPACLDGWARVAPNHHLCPACARGYFAVKAEMEAELNAIAGIAEPA